MLKQQQITLQSMQSNTINIVRYNQYSSLQSIQFNTINIVQYNQYSSIQQSLVEEAVEADESVIKREVEPHQILHSLGIYVIVLLCKIIIQVTDLNKYMSRMTYPFI